MDPISMTASIITILQLTANISSYVNSCKHASKQQAQIAIEISSLYSLLTNLRFRVEEARSDDPWFNEVKLLNTTNGPLTQFKAILERLVDKFQCAASDTPVSRIKSTLTWKLNKSEVEDLLQQIERLKSLIDLALSKDHFVLSQAIHTRIDDLAQDVQALRLATDVKIVQEVKKWLQASDPTTNYDAARQKHLSGTGSWLPLEPVVQGWKQSQSQMIWLHGIPGCGKTILSSTMISDLIESARHGLDTVVAFFFFDFRDVEKQTTASLIRSLLAQICQHDEKALQDLRELHEQYKYSKHQKQPRNSELSDVLKNSLLRLPSCHIVLDALDESSTRQSLLLLLRELKAECHHVHLLVTSRNERDIEEALSGITDHSFDVCNSSVDHDIRTYIRDCLETLPRLRKWSPSVKQEIETVLTQKADGMFQWVNCQIEVLEKCLQLKALRKTLNSLPKNLDATYERILQNIDANGYLDSALHVLRWLCFAVRPLKLAEVVDILATTTSAEGAGFLPDGRLLDFQDVRLICANLIVLTNEPVGTKKSKGETWVNLAHYSVREYLLSARCSFSSVFEASLCHVHIAETCLLYLHAACVSASTAKIVGSPWRMIVQDYPLFSYAEYDCRKHLQQIQQKLADYVMEIALKILLEENLFRLWLKLEFEEGFGTSWHYDAPPLNLEGPFSRLPGPLFCAVCLGNEEIVERLIETGAAVNSSLRYYSPLSAAAEKGYDGIVKLLLRNGAVDVLDFDEERNRGSAIFQAIEAGRRSTVQILLNPQATSGNHADLLDYYVRIIGGSFNFGTEMSKFVVPLAIKSILSPILVVDKSVRDASIIEAVGDLLMWGRADDLVMLIDGMSVTDFHQGGQHFSCLVNQAAAAGDWRVLHRLLNKGGGVRAVPEQTACALIASARHLSMEVMSQLLRHGADANSISDIDGTALNAVIRQAWSSEGHGNWSQGMDCLEFVDVLFKHCSDVNMRAGAFWLEPNLIWPGDEEFCVEGENISGHGKFQGSPLQLAIQADDVGLVQWLLEKGADPNLADDPLGNAFLTALVQGKTKVAQLLTSYDKLANDSSFSLEEIVTNSAEDEQLDKLAGVIVSRQQSIGDALTLATKWHRLSMVKSLLSKSNKLEQGINGYLPSVSLAISNEYWDIFELLISHGAALEDALLLPAKSMRSDHARWILERYASQIEGSGPRILIRALKYVVSCLYLQFITLLLKYNADVDMEDNGQSAIDCLRNIVLQKRELSVDDGQVILLLLSRSRNTEVVDEIMNLIQSQFNVVYADDNSNNNNDEAVANCGSEDNDSTT